ncbi:hypothetical protein [Allomuricauda sp. F6463D]|uniref:hypothetical protein n=1 Tax=Allomuricauda sp. F6463D TaxID=2926409 RepID=UPI001FF5E231|nr:hypothetical protein [Muricauda sp. F6463D]MCK0160367.1 hypothetical protein [Muricauda sp. F6463D]
MKRIQLILGIVLIIGCAQDNNTLEDITFKGGYVVFSEAPNLSFNILKLDTEVFTATIQDPNENASSYTLSAVYEDGEAVAENLLEVKNFPYAMELNIGDLLKAMGIAEEDVELTDRITLVATVVTPTGTFNGMSPNYDFNYINQGGSTTNRLKQLGHNNAMEFTMGFFQPPGKKIRGTSFEEPLVGSEEDVYNRNGANDETLDLVNGVAPPYVDYTSKGTGSDDELGFNSEYVAISNISASSIGFVEERIGVMSLFEDYEEYPDGVQGFHSEDADGAIRITFDTVEVPEGQNNSGVSFEVYFGDTSWEALDGIHAYANITTDNGDEVLELIQIYDDDIEAVAGQWMEVNSGFQKGIRSYQLVIQIQSGATAESFDLDNVIVYEAEE